MLIWSVLGDIGTLLSKRVGTYETHMDHKSALVGVVIIT